MKKLLVLIIALAVTSSATYASSSFWKSLKSAVRQDVQETRQAIRTDIENSQREQANVNAARKREALKEVNSKLYALNKEMREVKYNKNISETERLIRTRSLQRQIDFCNMQKKEIQKW